MKKLTYEHVKEYIESLGYILISKEYINTNVKLILMDFEGYYYTISFSNLKKGNNPYRYDIHNEYSIQNISLWIKYNCKPFILLSNKYNGHDKHLQFKCLKEGCEEIFEASWNKISNNKGCPFCCHNPQKVGLSNCLKTKNPELAKQWNILKNKNITPYDVTPFSNKYAWWICNNCKNEWYAQISSRSSRDINGCPDCNSSNGEKRIKEVLINMNLPYDKEYIFPDLIGVGGGFLRFDVPVFWNKEKTQLRILIEFDGEQHFKWKKGMMTKEEFERIQIHDKMKDNYCKLHNIKLLRIPHWDYDNIENILLIEFK